MKTRKQDVRPLRGFRELSPEDFATKLKVIETSRAIFRLYGYEEIEIPTVEPAALIELKSGEEIRHRMFRFRDLGGHDVVLRPEGTPSVTRYVASRFRGRPLPIRLAYVANMFRYDEPQRGRFREFTHIGAELFGSSSMLADMEIIDVTLMMLSKLGFDDFIMKIGHQGILRAVLGRFGISGERQDEVLGMIDRKDEHRLADALRTAKPGLSHLMKELTGIRGKSVEAAYKRARDLLKDMPLALESLDELEELATSGSEAAGGKVVVDLGFARGIEYYTGMIFEVSVRGLNLAVAGGGRYDGLCSLFGADLPAVGMALGVDRLVLGEEFEQIAQPPPVATVMILDPKSQGYGLRVAKELRAGGIPTTLDLSMGSLSSRMEKVAGREFRFAILVGQKEAAESKVTVRDMKTGTQETIPLGDTIRLIERASREG